jgi:quinone-modifying oxidoreductase subunit QmoC
MANGHAINPDLEFIREVKKAGGESLNKCYQCATCSTVCNLSPADKPFPRKEMLMAQWGQTDRLVSDPDIWLCYQCNDCSTYCPRGVRPGDVLAGIRAYVYKHYAFPSFMGRALAKPSALPVLLLIPAIILLASIFLFAPQVETGDFLFMTTQTIDFDYFLPHSKVDALFVIGNILIFIFAAVGFLRFWRDIRKTGDNRRMSFFSAFVITFKEILSHSRFNKCEANKGRSIGHILTLYGFIGAMFTTGAIFLFVFIPHYLDSWGLAELSSWFTVPIDIPHPVKFLGAFSGVAIMVGTLILLVRRWTNKDEVGASGFVDQSFLYLLFLVGVTGMLSWLTRLMGVPMVAYVIYYIHILVVFWLLWYMPYSKFAHMFYRTMALTYAKAIGREPRS